MNKYISSAFTGLSVYHYDTCGEKYKGVVFREDSVAKDPMYYLDKSF